MLHVLQQPVKFGHLYVCDALGRQRGRFAFDQLARLGQFEGADIQVRFGGGRRRDGGDEHARVMARLHQPADG